MTNTPGAIPRTYSTTPCLFKIPSSSFKRYISFKPLTSQAIPCPPITSGTSPVAFDIAVISTIVFVPSLKAHNILGDILRRVASSNTVSGLQARSIRLFFPLPITSTFNPIAVAKSYNSITAPGSSPLVPVYTTPASWASLFKYGPITTSDSTFIITMCFLPAIASKAILAPTSGTPVTSTTTSISGVDVTSFESLVATYFPALMAALASATSVVLTICSGLTPPYSKACTAKSILMSQQIAGLSPLIITNSVTIPRPICPAPTTPT